jgi:hypothetical protein
MRHGSIVAEDAVTGESATTQQLRDMETAITRKRFSKCVYTTEGISALG